MVEEGADFLTRLVRVILLGGGQAGEFFDRGSDEVRRVG